LSLPSKAPNSKIHVPNKIPKLKAIDFLKSSVEVWHLSVDGNLDF